MKGKTVFEQKKLTDTELVLNVSEFEIGTYIITVESNLGTSTLKE